MANSVLAATGTAHAYCRTRTTMETPGNPCPSEGPELWWRRQCVSFSVAPREDADPPLERVRDVVDVAFRTWTNVECNGMPIPMQVRQTAEVSQCTELQYNRYGPNANTVMFLWDWDERGLSRDAFGLTWVSHDPRTGEIFDADMQINETIGPLAICDGGCPVQSGVVDMQNVITHEAGHFLGLGHSDVHAATMSRVASVEEISKRDLDEDDRLGLCSIYGDYAPVSCQTTDFAPNRGFTALCSSTDTSPPSDPNGCNCAAVGTKHQSAPSWALLLLGLCCARGLLRRKANRR